MSTSSGFQAMPGWYWPDGIPKSDSSDQRPNASTNSQSSSQAREGARTDGQRRPKRRYWPPRQCRICLETVQPTFHTPSESLPAFLQGAPNVSYESEEGRLIRPCKCKGSSKYVHEGCLQAWRHADPSYGRRNYWECPTCGFRYRLARLGWGRFVASTSAQIIMTIGILFFVVFILGFFADTIIDMYLDPWSYFMPFASRPSFREEYLDDEPSSWTEHFLKGFTSVGVVGFIKVFITSPLRYWRLGGRGRATGRDRYEQISWIIILVGVFTFLVAIFKGVRAWTRRTLEKAGERVMDVQGDDDDDEEEQAPPDTS